MRISKKILACVLAALMALTMMPFTALAADDVAVAYTEKGPVYCETFEDALEAISTVTTAKHSKAVDPNYDYKTYYVADGRIALRADCTSNGIIIGSGSRLSVDLSGHTLDINAKPVGSNGTESIALQLLKGSDITFKNGTLTSSYTYASTNKEHIQRLIQNYADLTFDDVDVTFKGNFKNQATISHCNGNLVLEGGSTLAAPDYSRFNYTVEEAATNLGALAAIVGTFSTYTDASATVDEGSAITGNVKVQVLNPETAVSNSLELTSGSINGDIVMGDNAGKVKVSKAETFTQDAPEGYEWVAGETAGTQKLVEDTHSVAKVNGTKYDSLADAIAAANAGDTITLIADVDLTAYARSEAHKINLSGMVLDLDGHTISNKNKGVVFVGDNFTVKNGNMVCVNDPSFTSYKPDNSYGIMIWPEDGDDVHDTVADPSENVVLENLNVTGGINCFGANVTIKGENTNVAGTAYYAVWANAYTTIDIEDGTFTTTANRTSSTIGAGVETGKGAINVKGGNFTVESGKVLVHDNTSKDRVIISGGSYHYANGNVYTVLPENVADGYVQDMTTGRVNKKAEDTMSITVQDNIDLNINLDTSSDDAETIEYTYTNPYREDAEDIQTVTKSAKGDVTSFKVNLAPAQIKDDIIATVKDKDGEAIRTVTTSISDYCNTIITTAEENPDAFGAKTEELADLAKSTLDYGKAAAEFFHYNQAAYAGNYILDNPAEAILDLARDAAAPTYDRDVMQITDISYRATTIPELRFYIDADEREQAGLADLILSSNIGRATFVKNADGAAMLRISNIDIQDFNKEIVVKYKTDEYADEKILLTFTPILWVNAAIQATSYTEFSKLGQAIGNYYLKSVGYFQQN